MNVYFILFGLLSGAVPTEVVPARNNLLAGHIRPRQSAPPFTAKEDYKMKDAGIRTWTAEHKLETLTRHRRKRADQLQKTKSTAGLEKDTDDPDGVYRTLDELKSMKPGPGVQWRDEMPVLSKESAGDLRRKKRSKQIAIKQTITSLNRPYENGLKYRRELFSMKEISRQNAVTPSMKSMRLPFSSLTGSDGAGKSFRAHQTGSNGRLQHSANMRTLHKTTLFQRLENIVHKLNLAGNIASSDLSAGIQAWPGINMTKKDHLKDTRSYETVKDERKSHHRSVRDTESSDRTFDSTDVPLSADADQWWNKKLNYIDNRNRANYRIKLQQANTSADNSENMPEQRRTSISLRGVISDDRSLQTSSKHSLQGENSGEFGDKKQSGTDKKSDDWLKNELMLIEIESRALKRKAAQLHNKLRKANLGWKEMGADNAQMYATDGPRHDVIETYSRLNKRIEHDGLEQRLGGIRNIEATEHRIERKHRLPAYGERVRPDISDAVMKLDNDLADLKSRMSQTEKDTARPRVYYVKPNIYHDIYYDTNEYYPRRIFRRYRRNVNNSLRKQWYRFHMFLNSTRDLSSSHQVRSDHVQTHNYEHGDPCPKLAHTDSVTYITVREPRHKTGTWNIIVERAPNSRVPTMKQKVTFRPHWNASFKFAKAMDSNKGKHPTTINGRIARIIVSLARILRHIPTLWWVYSHKYPLLNTYGISWPVDDKMPSIVRVSENFTVPRSLSDRKHSKTQVNLCVLITQAGDNEVLTVLKTTSHRQFTFLRVWNGNRKCTVGRICRCILKQTQISHKNKPPYAAAKRRQSVDRQNTSFPSSESKTVSRQTFDSHYTQKQVNRKTPAKVDQNNTVDLYLYLKTSFLALQKKQMTWPRLQVPPRSIRLIYKRVTVYPSILILCSHSPRGLHSKHTEKADFLRHHMPHTVSLRFLPFPARDIHKQHIQQQPGQRHVSNNRNRVSSMSTLANIMKQYDKAKKRDFFQRTLYDSGLWGTSYVNLRLRLDSRLFAPHFRKSRLMVKYIGQETVASPLHFTDTERAGHVFFKNKLRHKRSNDGISANELSMREDLDNLFNQFPVSESEKLMNSKLQQAEEAQLASTDVGRFIIERNKDTDSTQDVLSSDTRFRRQVLPSEDRTDHKMRLDKQKHLVLGAILRYTTNHANSPESKLGGKEKEHAPRSLPSVQLFGNNSFTFLRDSLDKQKYKNSLQTIGNSRESMKQKTYTSKVPQNSRPYNFSKLVSLLDTVMSGIPFRFPRDTHDSNVSENISSTYVTTSPEATSGDTESPGLGGYTSDMGQYDIPIAFNYSYSNDSDTNETNLNTDMFPATDLNVELLSVDNTTNITSLPNLHNVSSDTGVGKINETKQSPHPSSLMLNSSDKNVTNINSALKSFMANSTSRNITEFNKAIKTFMTNSSYRNSSVVGDKQVNTGSNAGLGQNSVVDYFDNNANLEEASGASDEQAVPGKSTDTQIVEDKAKAEKPETSEGIQVDVKGHKVEPAEPFAFIEKDEVKAPTEYLYTWSEWSECSATCGIGQKFRSNRCGGDQPCTGDKASSETEVCSIQEVC